MPIPSTPPHTWSGGEDATTDKMQSLTDWLNFLRHPPKALLRQTAGQAFTSGTWAAVTFDTEDQDDEGGHSASVNLSRYTVPAGGSAGWYDVDATVAFPIGSGLHYLRLQVDGVAVTGRSTANGTGELSLSHKVYLGVGDYLEVAARQDSGATVTTSASTGIPEEVGSTLQLHWFSV